MSENNTKLPPEEPSQEEVREETSSYTPASFERRVIAWMGVVYMVILVLATTYLIATASYLTGTAPILVAPAAVGAAVIVIHKYRKGEISQGRNFMLAAVFLCVVAFATGLACGVPPLLEHVKGLFA